GPNVGLPFNNCQRPLAPPPAGLTVGRLCHVAGRSRPIASATSLQASVIRCFSIYASIILGTRRQPLHRLASGLALNGLSRVYSYIVGTLFSLRTTFAQSGNSTSSEMGAPHRCFMPHARTAIP